MKKVVVLILLIMLVGHMSFGLDDSEKAEELKKLGILKGTNEGLELDKEFTRAQAAVMLVRILGAEEKVSENKHTHPFIDVPEWASNYVGYLYEAKLATGIDDKNYGANNNIKAKDYITFILRSLNYDDQQGDFSWINSLEKAKNLEIINEDNIESFNSNRFLRSDMVNITFNALNTNLKNSDKTLLSQFKNGIDKSTQEKPVIFVDSILEEKVRNKIEVYDEEIYPSDLWAIEELRLSSKGIESLEGLENFKNVKTLNLSYNKLTDISPLKSLTKLEDLTFRYNRVEDLTPLRGLINLKSLNGSHNLISDIEPLKNLKKLEKLDLSVNLVEDISSLMNLENLQSIALDDNRISDISTLNALDNIKVLDLNGNDIISFKPIEDIYSEIRKDFYYEVKYDFQSDYHLLNEENDLLVDGENYKIELLSYHKDEKKSYYIPLKRFFDLIGVHYMTNSSGDIIVDSYKKVSEVDNTTFDLLDGDDIMMQPTANKIIINGLEYYEKLPILEYQGVVYAPIDRLTKYVDFNFSYNSSEDLKKVNTDNIEKIRNLNNLLKNKTESSPEGQYSFEGQVLSNTNEPIENAMVYLYNLDEEVRIPPGTFTDEEGRFIFKNRVSGKYKLVSDKKGFIAKTVKLDIKDNTKNFKINLEPGDNSEWIKKETKNIIYYHHPGYEIDQVEIDRANDFVDFLLTFFNYDLERKINYYITSDKEIQMYSSYLRQLQSQIAVHYHELVHAIHMRVNSDSNYGFGEGIAYYFGWGDYGNPSRKGKLISTEAKKLMQNNELASVYSIILTVGVPTVNFYENASFMTFLLDKYTINQFRMLFNELPRNRILFYDEAVIDDIFYKVYKKSPFELYNEWREYLGGKRVEDESNTFRRWSQIEGTINIEGKSYEDIAGKITNLRNEYYKKGDNVFKDNPIAAGVDDFNTLPQRLTSQIFLEAEVQLLLFQDPNRDFILDDNEPRAIVPLTLDYYNPIRDLEIILKFPE